MFNQFIRATARPLARAPHMRSAPAQFGIVRATPQFATSTIFRTTALYSTARVASKGSVVGVHYTGTLEDGSKFDSSYDRGEALTFTVGAGQMIPGFDKAVEGLKVGDKKTVRLAPIDAYGEYDPEGIFKVPVERAPGLSSGDMVQLPNGMPAVVKSVTDTEVEIDANHMLAGKVLVFDIEIDSVA